MGKYSIKDFKVGDSVFHLSNSKLLMVVIEINSNMNEITCRWIDIDGQVQRVEFIAEELGKVSDLGPRMRAL